MFASLLLGANLLYSPVDVQYVTAAGKILGDELVKNIKLIEGTISEVGTENVTANIGKESGVTRDMMFELRKDGVVALLKVVEVGSGSSTLRRVGAKELPPEWKGAAVSEAPTIGVAGVYDELVEGFDDLSRDFCQGVQESFKQSKGLNDVASLASIEPVAEGFLAMDAKESSARKAMFDATGSTILCIGNLKKESNAWVVTMEAIDSSSGAVRAKAEQRLVLNQLDTYMPGATLYDFKMIDKDDSRRVLSGQLGLGSFKGNIGLMAQSATFLLVLANKTFGSNYDVNFHWQSNRIGPPNNPPEGQCTLVLHYRDIKNWDGVRFAGNEAFIIGMQNGVQWIGQESAKLEYPNVDTDDGSKIDVSVKAKKVTIRAGKNGVSAVLPAKFPPRVGFSCVGDDGDPKNSFRVFGCKVKRGAGI